MRSLQLAVLSALSAYERKVMTLPDVYPDAWGLIYMILYYGESKTVRQECQQWFSDLFSAAKKGRVTAETVEERLGGREKFLELEQRWKDWIKDLPYDYDPR